MKTKVDGLPVVRGNDGAHPEEMIAKVDLRIGSAVRFKAKARATPAGLIAVAILGSSLIVASGWIVRTVLRERR